MIVDRRCFLSGAAALLASVATPLPAAGRRRLYAAARSSADGRHSAAIFDASGADAAAVDLPARAHQIVAHPHDTACIAVARRPGTFAVLFGPGRSPVWIDVGRDRRFLGHGAFSPDGRLFYTTEEDYDGERGVIGVRDAADGFRPLGELSTHGIGPHELALVDGGRTLVVANGGLPTHPERGEESHDLDRMRSSLVCLDAKTGDLAEKRELPEPLRRLSLRHIAIAADGTLAVGGQHYGAAEERPPLVGLYRRGRPIDMLAAPRDIQRQMRNYVGSIAIDASGRIAAASCPRGNLVAFWDIAARRCQAYLRLPDGCGAVAADAAGRFLLSSGLGALGEARPGDTELAAAASHGWRWDNHLSRLG